jgi:hypothetical protein
METDPVTRAYFREVDPGRPVPPPLPKKLREALATVTPKRKALPPQRKPSRFERELRAAAPDVQARALEQLAYLTNVLVAGEGLRPVDAAQRALATCDLGLTKLATLDAVKAFRIGWHRGAKSGRRR